MCVHFQLKAKGCLFYRRLPLFLIITNQFPYSSTSFHHLTVTSKQINIWWAHVSSLVSSTTSPRWAPASTTWRSWRTSPAHWWVTTSEVLTKFAKFRWQHCCTYCRLTADNSEKDIVCDQKVCVHHCLLWPVTSMPAAEMSDKTLLAVAPSSPPPLGHETRDTAAQCKWHSGVIQSPASLHFPDQPQARSDRKVTTSLAWLGSRKTGDTGEWKYLPHNSYI